MIAERVKDFGNRDATLLEGESVRVVVTDKGGMVPELSFPSGNGWFNTHWLPYFRSNSDVAFDPSRHGEAWGVELLYELAGNFLCLPNFGGGCTAYDTEMPPHGLTANGRWTNEKIGVLDDRVAYSRASIRPEFAYPSLPLSITKYDIVMSDHPGHYIYLRVRNDGQEPLRFTIGWHNTIGAPFLSPGCLIDLCADSFATAPSPSEFDDTGRLKSGAEFGEMSAAPLADGGAADLRLVPGMIGYTDFLTGAVPKSANVGWSSVVNPQVGAMYLSVFRGPAAVGAGEIPILFNDLWLQYGGRPVSPWAARPGGTDYTYCLGAENATGGYANGLEYSLAHDELLGHPTTVEIAPGEVLDHVYVTYAVPYDDGALDGGVDKVEITDAAVVAVARNTGKSVGVPADANLDGLASIAGEIDGN